MVSASTLRRQLDQLRKLLAVRDAGPPDPEPWTDRQSACARALVWKEMVRLSGGDGPDTEHGSGLVRAYEARTGSDPDHDPDPAATEVFLRELDAAWQALADANGWWPSPGRRGDA
jgi:hypothetical protein